MAVLFKDAEGVGYNVYLVDFDKKEIAPFELESGEDLSHLENDDVTWFGTHKFSDECGQEILKKVFHGLIVQVDFTAELASMYKPVLAANDEVYEPKEGEVYFYRSPEGRGIAVDFFNGVWAPISSRPLGSVRSLIHYPLSLPINGSAFGGTLQGKLVPEMIKTGYIKLETKEK